MKKEPKIIFEDSHLIVLSKPAGLLSQGEKTGSQNLVDWLRKYLGRKYVGLIHRLDRNTSGIMVVAKRTKAARRLSEALKKREISRTYLGCILGIVEKPVTWTHWLLKDTEKNEVKAVSQSNPKAKKAILHLTPKKSGLWNQTPITLAEFELETGRSHQIRIQTSAKGKPLLGDPKYGKQIKDLPLDRPALHSYQISFPHPMSGEILKFKAPLPSDIKKITDQI